jgi:hypothetical protein
MKAVNLLAVISAVTTSEDDMAEEKYDPNMTYGMAGIFIYSPSKRWADAGVMVGDFLSSTSLAGALSTSDKIHNALAAPAGTVLLVERMVEGKPKRVEVELK